MPQRKLVLLTGATGFVGFRTLVLALQAGYAVRCAIRDPKKADNIVSNPAIKKLNLKPNSITFVTVPDLTVKGAYQTAIQDVTHVIHVASPLPSANPDAYKDADKIFIQPAVRGAIEMLEAALHTSTVKCVAITSSVRAMVPNPIWLGLEPSTEIYGPASRLRTPSGPFSSSPEAYGASKTAQMNAIEDWTQKNNPAFPVVTIHPSFVLGRADLATTVEELWAGTNRFALDLAIGTKLESPWSGACVHVDDVAKVHVMALDQSFKGVRSFVLSMPAKWDDVPQIVEKHFPAAVEEGLLSIDGRRPTNTIDIRGDETEKEFGFQFLDFEEQVKSVVGQLVAIKKQ